MLKRLNNKFNSLNYNYAYAINKYSDSSRAGAQQGMTSILQIQ